MTKRKAKYKTGYQRYAQVNSKNQGLKKKFATIGARQMCRHSQTSKQCKQAPPIKQAWLEELARLSDYLVSHASMCNIICQRAILL